MLIQYFRKSKMAKKFYFVVVIVAMMFISSTQDYCADFDAQGNVQFESRLQEFVQYRKQQDYEGVWKLLSVQMKSGNNNKQADYERFVRSNGFHSSDFELKKVVKSERTYSVTVIVTYVDNSTGKEIGKSEEEWKFIFESNTWFFDGYKTLSEVSN
jgi:hypothetical protein